ncbi:MAG: sulfite exporter TauE/SafE family protein [Gammaproteobacteria bacterium]|nr:sulfite exporter TauE/SafE family protein [Gammaproteobacteria bacterium]MBM4210597.1 sulfite exporter TauE/SafE family protein [Gammaproteobacteria bacterium]
MALASDPSTLWLLALLLMATGLCAGLLAGLLGVGGGIVMVPVLDLALPYAGFPREWCMHVAVATSLAAIVPTSISSARAHHRRGGIDWDIARAWAPGIILGGLAGSLLASRASDDVLTGVFGAVAALISLKMFLPLDHLRLAERVPKGLAGKLIATVIGGVSSMMGIGGGTLSVPAMTLTGGAIHQAVGTAAFFGLLLSVPGTLGYLLASPGVALPGATVGLVSLLALALVAPLSMLTAPAGARLAHSLDKRTLSKIFGGFLSLVALRMLFRTFA